MRAGAARYVRPNGGPALASAPYTAAHYPTFLLLPYLSCFHAVPFPFCPRALCFSSFVKGRAALNYLVELLGTGSQQLARTILLFSGPNRRIVTLNSSTHFQEQDRKKFAMKYTFVRKRRGSLFG